MKNEVNSFKIMAAKSDEIGLTAILDNFNVIKYKKESEYSANDYLIKLDNGRIVMVEIKVRNRQYDALMIDYKKIVNLRKKEQEYRQQGLIVADIWYVNVIYDNLFIFSINDLREKSKTDDIIKVNRVMSAAGVEGWMQQNPNKYLFSLIAAPKHTAIDGNHMYEDKWAVFMPITMITPNDKLINYNYKLNELD